MSFVCSDLKHISQYALVTDYAYKTMKRFSAGTTLSFWKHRRLVPKIILPKKLQESECRIIKFALALVRELGQPGFRTSIKTADGEHLAKPYAIKDALTEWLI